MKLDPILACPQVGASTATDPVRSGATQILIGIHIAVLIVLLTTASGCSTDRPSDEDVRSAVGKSLQRNVPTTLARYLTGGTDASIEEIRVLAIGKPSEQSGEKTWPVKLYVRGDCSVLLGGRRDFEGEVEYFVCKDPYGDWIARFEGL